MTTPSFAYVTRDPAIYQSELKRFRSASFHIISTRLRDLMTPIGMAHAMPVCIVKARPDLNDLIRRHAPNIDGEGECQTQWHSFMQGRRPEENTIILDVRFSAPAKLCFTLEFNLLANLPFLERCFELDTMCLSYPQADPLRQGVGLPALAQPEFGLILAAARRIEAAVR